MPKPEILDPQGKAVAGTLPRLGFTQFSGVRQGKRFELEVDGPVTPEVLAAAREAADRVLSNPIIEDVVNVFDASDELGGTRIGVITFPGTLDDRDAARAGRLAGGTAFPLWHADADLHGVDAFVLPGGFSYGDYLRAGAISRFAPVMETLVDAANGGLPVLGICNGFQILTEAHLLPGSMVKNDGLAFLCTEQTLVVENATTAWTRDYTQGERITIPLKNQDGQFVADERTLDELEGEGRVAVRYAGENPNGSRRGIAGITNAAGNVVGLMPHPEHAVEAGLGTAAAAGPRAGTDVTVELVPWDLDEVAVLRDEQQAELRGRYGAGEPGPPPTGDGLVAMVLVRVDGVASACGAVVRVRDPGAVEAVGDLAALVPADLLLRAGADLRLPTVKDERRHPSDGVRAAAVARRHEQLGVRPHERDGHRDGRAVGQDKAGTAGAEVLDDGEQVVPPSRVEARAVVAELVEDLLHLERRGQGLDEDGGPDRALGQVEVPL
ncbi:class I glutamine amidotransferase-like protein [Podospora conica]|nr:class I glutamine amidotransferase-like protein [Schizothecium conicum]